MEASRQTERRLQREVARFRGAVGKDQHQLGALIIQNNFDLPVCGRWETWRLREPSGRVNFLMRLNAAVSRVTRASIRGSSSTTFFIFPRKSG